METPFLGHHWGACFASRDYRYFSLSRILAISAYYMLIVVLGQYVYEITHHPLPLGWMGLAVFLPKVGLVFIAGHTADRYDRRKVILACRFFQTILVGAIFLFYLSGSQTLLILYGLLFLFGCAGAFEGPCSQALVPDLVGPKDFNNAVAWNSSLMQLAMILGPVVGGFIYALTGRALEVLLLILMMRLAAFLFFRPVSPQKPKEENAEFSVKNIGAGLRYVLNHRLLLGSLSLDLFAVLFGGAVALLPIFSNDILKTGATGLGLLRAAPSVGAGLMALWLARHPVFHQAGKTMLWCVALFGLSMTLFGFSKNFPLSVVCLAISGAADMVSVVIRGVLVQLATPPSMRGRVSAVNLVFIGASNELGEFESGVVASLIGTIPSVVVGGLATLAIVFIWARIFPELKSYHSSG